MMSLHRVGCSDGVSASLSETETKTETSPSETETSPSETETTPSETETFNIRDRDPIFFLANIFYHEKHHFFTEDIFLHEKHHIFFTMDIGIYQRLSAFFMPLFSFFPPSGLVVLIE